MGKATLELRAYVREVSAISAGAMCGAGGRANTVLRYVKKILLNVSCTDDTKSVQLLLQRGGE